VVGDVEQLAQRAIANEIPRSVVMRGWRQGTESGQGRGSRAAVDALS
jgi:hypothetical protein